MYIGGAAPDYFYNMFHLDTPLSTHRQDLDHISQQDPLETDPLKMQKYLKCRKSINNASGS